MASSRFLFVSFFKLRSGPRRFLGDGHDDSKLEEKRRPEAHVLSPLGFSQGRNYKRNRQTTPARKVVLIGAVAEVF